MLKKIAIAVVLTATLAGTAEAQDRYRHGGHHYRPHHGHQHHYRPNHYRGGNNWVAPLVGGMVLGGVIGALAAPSYGYAAPPPPPVYAPPQPLYLPNVVPGCYQTQMIDQWGRVVMGTVCQ